MASATALFSQELTAPPTASNTQVAAPAATGASSNAAPAGARRGRGGRRGAPDLGPVPEIHAAVPNTLPGLLGKPIKWVSTGILVAPQNDATHFLYSIKDPTIFRYNGKWEIYATANMVSGPAAAALLNPGTNQPGTGPRRGGGGDVQHDSRQLCGLEGRPQRQAFLHGCQTGLRRLQVRAGNFLLLSAKEVVLHLPDPAAGLLHHRYSR